MLTACEAVSADEQSDLFGRYLEGLRQQLGIPGLSALVIKNQQVVWESGLGLQDLQRRLPATSNTPYPIASLTKTFTSVLLLQCVERGTLRLDEPMRTFTALVPEAGATVRHVLTHTSEGTPGQTFRYNGDRYSTLTSVVETCHGAPFRQVIAREILDRTAMQDSVPGHDLEMPDGASASMFDAGTLRRYQQVLARISQPYTSDARGRATLSTFPPRDINAAAGLVSTVRDLALYDNALSSNVLLRPETLESAWTQHRNNSGQSIPYGLGWFVQTIDGHRVVWHFGQWSQFSALLLKVPSLDLTLIVLANTSGLSAPFPIASGDVTVSPFAAAFLRVVTGIR